MYTFLIGYGVGQQNILEFELVYIILKGVKKEQKIPSHVNLFSRIRSQLPLSTRNPVFSR